MRILSLALLSACALACSHPPPPAPPPPPPAPTLGDEVDALCACTTASCRTGVRAKFAGVDRPADTAPHTLALRAYLAKCDADGAEAQDLADMKAMDGSMCACRDAVCVDQTDKRYTDFMKRMEDKYKHKAPSEKMMELGEHMAKCMSDAMGGGSSASNGGSGIDSASSDGPTGVPACDEYLNAFDRYMSCDKIPQQAKDASRQGIAEMKRGWAMLRDPNVPAEARKAASDACREAVDALRQSAAAMGCPL
jgi:hypothetical protein